MHQIPDLEAVSSRSLLKQYTSLPAQLWHSRLWALLWKEEVGPPLAAVPARHLAAHPRANLQSLVYTSAAAALQTSWPGLVHPAIDTPTAPWNPLEMGLLRLEKHSHLAMACCTMPPWPGPTCDEVLLPRRGSTFSSKHCSSAQAAPPWRELASSLIGS